MHELPIASFLATEIVRRRLRYGDDTTPTRPARSVRQPVRRTRVALAGGFAWAARVVAPAGYRPAH
ncbi:MAG TPA: hypothetical protein VNA11_02485 [Pseudonocardia sp.]|jgi:hypothetical protein|nr:hypothetical protein [Pseudonocardia sp.]